MSIDIKTIREIADQVAILRHLSELAYDRIENDLDIGRATVVGDRVTLHFHHDGIEISTWVVGEVNSLIDKLDKQMPTILNDHARSVRVAA